MNFLWGAGSPWRDPLVFLGQIGNLIFLGSPHQALETLIIVGHAPLYLIPFFIIFLIYRVRLYLVFTLHHLSYYAFSVCHRTRTVHTAIELYDCCFPPLFSHFSIVYTPRIHTLGALQHCNTWISLEFHWNSTYIGTTLPPWWTKNILSGSMEIITWMFVKDIQG